MTVDSELEWTLRRRMRDNNLNQLDVARLLGKSRAWTGSQLLTDVEGTIWQLYQKDPDGLDRLAKALDWNDKFAMMLDLRIITHEEIEAFDAALKGIVRRTKAQSDDVRSSDRIRIPVYALAAAGAGMWTEEEIVTDIEVEPEIALRPNRTSFQVNGTSMEPTLEDGDTIHVDLAAQDIQDGKIFVLLIIGNGIVVKRARVYDDGTTQLVSDNPKHPPLHPDSARIIGRVFAVTPQTRKL